VLARGSESETDGSRTGWRDGYGVGGAQLKTNRGEVEG
jgi:hypothetical protein